ncbi:hypothetical protein BASA50_002182 [Batrachochytrium salamandrivorans]|uniref:HMG box domain-containing protein n=1 Tax=Batrachochytrium salamandrivorans TaxID=1357716 RepID=A0ABQ8FM41_9FUNG|nr:hypothetical protein BASA50_002182 [Batrachochytrium salamandrivorans]KAH9250599.1 hypothetical protein BASA81_011582 [Batrachochytrium salamandrivorans]KAH9272231.1 hypothetical protein BASA83_005573 [Batrachochytrium salamandrivorans]
MGLATLVNQLLRQTLHSVTFSHIYTDVLLRTIKLVSQKYSPFGIFQVLHVPLYFGGSTKMNNTQQSLSLSSQYNAPKSGSQQSQVLNWQQGQSSKHMSANRPLAAANDVGLGNVVRFHNTAPLTPTPTGRHSYGVSCGGDLHNMEMPSLTPINKLASNNNSGATGLLTTRNTLSLHDNRCYLPTGMASFDQQQHSAYSAQSTTKAIGSQAAPSPLAVIKDLRAYSNMTPTPSPAHSMLFMPQMQIPSQEPSPLLNQQFNQSYQDSMPLYMSPSLQQLQLQQQQQQQHHQHHQSPPEFDMASQVDPKMEMAKFQMLQYQDSSSQLTQFLQDAQLQQFQFQHMNQQSSTRDINDESPLSAGSGKGGENPARHQQNTEGIQSTTTFSHPSPSGTNSVEEPSPNLDNFDANALTFDIATCNTTARPMDGNVYPSQSLFSAPLSSNIPKCVSQVAASSNTGGATLASGARLSTNAPPLETRPPTHTPRPANSFLLYRAEMQAVVRKQYGSSEKVNNNAISKIVGELWRKESPEVKASYAARAAEVKRAHALQFPGYKYTPKKPKSRGPAVCKKTAASRPALTQTQAKAGLHRFRSSSIGHAPPNRAAHMDFLGTTPAYTRGTLQPLQFTHVPSLGQSASTPNDGLSYSPITPNQWRSPVTPNLVSVNMPLACQSPTDFQVQQFLDMNPPFPQPRLSFDMGATPLYKGDLKAGALGRPTSHPLFTPTPQYFSTDGMISSDTYQQTWPEVGLIPDMWSIDLNKSLMASLSEDNATGL